MKTKKLLFLTTILMVFFSVSAIAQRGTCTSGATNAYIGINDTWTSDKTDGLGATYTVPAGATVKIGSDPYLDKADIDFTIDISLDGVFQYQINKSNVATYSTSLYDITIASSLFTAGHVVTAAMTVIPAVGSTWYSCTNSWTYTYTLTTPSGCVPAVPTFFYQIGGAGSWNDPTSAVANVITVAPITVGKTIEVGLHLNGGTISAWRATGGGTIGTPNAAGNQVVYDPLFTADGETRTLSIDFTTCDSTTTYTYNLSSTQTCVGVTQAITQANYQVGATGWHDALTYAPIGQIDITAGSTISFGPWPTDGSKYTYSWSGAGAENIDVAQRTIREPTYNDMTGESCLLTATITYDDGCNPVATSSYTFKIIVDNRPLAVTKFDQDGFKMYPNPADNVLNIVFNGDVNVSITNVTGQQVLSPRSISKQGSIDVSSLSSGIYFLKADANGESTVRKFVKN